MKPENIHNKRILLSPLNWGMGHVARCIPIIQQLLTQKNQVFIACDTNQQKILVSYFPDLTFIFHSGYPFAFNGRGNFEKGLFFQFFKLRKRMKAEKKEVEKMIEDNAINFVLSDHRYGFISTKCTSIFITHQINLPVTRLTKWVDLIHKKLLKKFQTIWVLDTHDSQYAGKLSTNHSFKNIEYIGPKSRFSLYPKTEKTISKVVIISGPEPYSEQFFKSEYSISLKKNEPTVFILPRIYPTELKNKNCEFIESSDWKTCDLIILKAQIIFSRTGYSTIMDIAELNVKSVLIPTKGQKEQEYLFQLTK